MSPILRPCRHPGCPELVVRGGCAAHGGTRRRSGWRTDARYQDQEYRAARARLMKNKPNCSSCGHAEATTTHHIVPLSLGGTHSIENLAALCRACHDKITRAERTRRANTK